MFGGTGILAGKPSKLFCIPLSLTIQDGLKIVDDWTQERNRSNTHVVETIHQAHTVSKIVGHSILLLDRYFLSVPALEALNTLNQAHQTHLHLVTKAKKSCKAYEEPPAKSNGRGRPRKKGETVKVMNLFEEKRDVLKFERFSSMERNKKFASIR